MRAIERTSRFKRDYRREESGVLSFSSRRSICWRPTGYLPQRYFDHPLSGGMERLPRLLIKPDLVLINDKPDAHTLRLMRLGSHSELRILNRSRP